MASSWLSLIKSFIARNLVLVFILNALPLKGFAQNSSCKYGECVEKIVHRLEDLGGLYRKQCLPEGELSGEDLKRIHQKEGVTEECWKLMTEIAYLEGELQKQEYELENESIACADPGVPQGEDVNDQLAQLDKIEKKLSCTEEKKKEIKGKCADDLKCVLAASALGLGGHVAEKMLPKGYKPQDCHLGDDGCGVQLATGFLKAVVSFFEGAWDLLETGGKYAAKKSGDFWNWVSGADDHASTSQLALAKASEHPGIFDMLLKDFSGTMSKIFSGLVAALKEWFKTDVFCQKWAGVPHFSQCERPTDNFDCLPCKTMVTGLCSMTGTLVAEVIPAFLTGGMVTAAKHGVNGASKIAKLFRVSAKAMEVMKTSRVGKYAIEAGTKLDDVLRLSKNLRATKAAVSAALAAIKAYLHSPLRIVLNSSHSVLLELTKKGKIFLAETRTGKVIVFSASAVKTTGKVVIYPIDNHLTTWAYKAGERSFEKLFKLGVPRLSPATTVARVIIKADPELEKALARLEAMKISRKTTSTKLLEQEEKVLELLGPQRAALVDSILAQESPDLSEIITHLYPELHYGPLAGKVGPVKIRAAEKELFEAISKMPEGPLKSKLLKRFEHNLSSVPRKKIMGEEDATIIMSGKKAPAKSEAQATGTTTGPADSLDATKPATKTSIKDQGVIEVAQDSIAARKTQFTSQYGIESVKEVEALGLPTSANNRSYLGLHHKAPDKKVVAFSSETTVLKDGNEILGRETMTAAENMYQETFMDVLRHDENGSAIWKSMSRTDAGVLHEIKVPLSESTRDSLIMSLKSKARPPAKLSLTHQGLLEKLEASGVCSLTSEETALLFRLFPDKMRELSVPITKKQGAQFKKMLEDLGKDADLSESEKFLKHRLTQLVDENVPMKLKAEEISIMDGMSTRVYSGFKSIEGAVDWDAYKLVLSKRLDVAPGALDDATVAKYLQEDFAKLDREVKSRFTIRMEGSGYDLSSAKGKMSGKRIQNYSDWKAMGVSRIPPDGTGSAIDEAAMAARAGRAKEGKGISTYDDLISSSVVSKVRIVEGTSTSPGLRRQILNSLSKRGISSEKLAESGILAKIPEHYLTQMGYKGPRPQYVFSEKVWAVVRKSSDYDEITNRLNSLFPFLGLTKEEAKLLRSHYEALDALSPAIHTESRGALPVAFGLRKGGVLDVQGLGALNAQWNDAASMVASLNGKSDDAVHIISATRAAEVTGSTPAYKLRVDSMVKTVKEELGPGWVVRVSGDDVIFYPDRRIITDHRGIPPRRGRRTVSGIDPPEGLIGIEDINEAQVNVVVKGLDRLAKKGLSNADYGGSSLSRATFVRGEGAKEAHITMLEGLEKNLRIGLEKDVGSKAINLETLSNTVIGFDAHVPTEGKVLIRVVIPKDSAITNEILNSHLLNQKASLQKSLEGRPFEFKIDRI